MKVLLRIIAILEAIAVLMTIVVLLQFAVGGWLSELVASGAVGIATLVGWILIICLGPFAVIQLWRLKRSGLLSSAVLFGVAFSYYFVGLLFFRGPDARWVPIVLSLSVNGALLGLLLSPQARRICS